MTDLIGKVKNTDERSQESPEYPAKKQIDDLRRLISIRKNAIRIQRHGQGMFEFAHRIIDATADIVCAYKPNMAFFQPTVRRFSLLRLIVQRIPEHVPIILDGKRGDIGNTSQFYAESLFNIFRADWVTINPYMGYDSMRPFLENPDKGGSSLCLTSNRL